MAVAHRVFISYQRTDETFARSVREHLVAAGVTTWMDQHDIPVGAYWPDAIDAALAASDVVIGVLSPDAVESRNVKNEWDWAIANGKRLLLVQVRPCLIPHRYVSINFIDGTGPDTAPALAALSRALGIAAREEASMPSPIRHAHHIPRPAARVATRIAGRQREQALLRAQFDALLVGRGSVVLVGGEAGIGKTTLTNWLAGEAESEGALVLSGGCYDLSTTPPYGPWIEIVRGWPQDESVAPLPDALRSGEALATLGSQTALFDLVADVFATASVSRPLVLLLEDLHWADQASLDLLRFLARLADSARLLLVATYRDDELTRRHPLFALLPVLAREAQARRLALRRLDDEALRALVARDYTLSDADAERLIAYVSRLAEGNPFFTGEVLRALEESATLAREGEGWTLAGLDRALVPALLREVVESRLARLGAESRRLLEIAAVIGHEASLDLWVSVSGEDEAALAETLERAVEARLVEELPGGERFRFIHALVREVLYEGIVSLRKRTWHRQAAEALAATARPDPDEVAHHFERANDRRASDWLIRAGQRAYQQYAWPAALERWDRAILLLDDPLDRSYVLEAMWAACRYAEHARSFAYIDDAAREAAASGDRFWTAHTRFERAWAGALEGDVARWLPELIDLAKDIDTLVFGEDALDYQPPTLWPEAVFGSESEIAAGRRLRAAGADQPLGSQWGPVASLLANLGRSHEALRISESLVAFRESLPDSQPTIFRGLADNSLGIAYRTLGQPERARRALAAQASMHRRDHNPLLEMFALANAIIVEIEYAADRPAERRRLAEERLEARRRAIGALNVSMGDPTVSSLRPLEGQWSNAGPSIAESGLARGRWLVFGPGHQIASRQAQLAAHQGRVADAWSAIESMLPDGPATEPGSSVLLHSLVVQRVAAELSLDAGDLSTARAWLEAHDRWLEWSGSVLGRAEGSLLWSRYHWLSGDNVTAWERARQSLVEASEPRRPLAILAANRHLGQLATEAGQLDAASEHLTSALTLATTCEAPFERALTLVAIAELDMAGGDTLSAATRLAEARAICEPLGARPTLECIATLDIRTGGVA